MIEVEKKFILSEGDKEKLLEGADFVGEVKLEDAYYDKPDFSLIKSDRYLRNRNGRFELKLPVSSEMSDVRMDTYQELEDDEEIKEALGLGGGSIEIELDKAGYSPVAEYSSVRRKYKRGEYTIDIDEVSYGYSILEIEVMVNELEGVDAGGKKILDLVESLGLDVDLTKDIRGKLLEYLFREKPDTYEDIVKYWRELGTTGL